MRRLWKISTLSAIAPAALAGSIHLNTPVLAGEVITFEGPVAGNARTLSETQLRAISGWLSWNRRGWVGTKAVASGEPIQLQLNLKQSDGTLATVSVVSEADGSRHLVFSNNGATWSYQAWHGMFKAPAATRPLADYEFKALQKIVASR
jgi:hypothetical protein